MQRSQHTGYRRFIFAPICTLVAVLAPACDCGGGPSVVPDASMIDAPVDSGAFDVGTDASDGATPDVGGPDAAMDAIEYLRSRALWPLPVGCAWRRTRRATSGN